MKKQLNVSLWTNRDSGNALSHRGGLTQEQVDAIKELKVGDRFIVFANKKRDRDTSPHFNLKLFGGDSANGGAGDDGSGL